MEEVKFGIIVCEKCYKIPEITILNKNNVQIKCKQCNDIIIKDISYFNKFYQNEKVDMPKCNYNKNHQFNSNLYCFQCEKYLCEECIKIHNISFEGKNHIFIKQKMNNQYYCNKNGHSQYIIYKYCTLCYDYLCSQCKCEHKDSYIYNFEENKYKEKIKQIIDKLAKYKKLIEDEELKFNQFIEEIENKIKAIKSVFNNYKETNTNIINFYNLLINNYQNYYNIRNYNIVNNIIINDNFDFSVSKSFNYNKNLELNECFTSKYNKLYSFYNNKIHIKSKEDSNYFITKNFCKKNKIKKCIFINEKLISFIFTNDNYIYFFDKDNKNEIIKKKINCKYIKDIYPLNSKEIIFRDEYNILQLYNINENKNTSIKTKYKENIFSFIIPNLRNKDKYFMISNNDYFFSIYYYINNKNIPLIYKENKLFDIKCLFNAIKIMITDLRNNFEEEEKIKLNNLFFNKYTEELINIYEYLFKLYSIDKITEESLKIYKELFKIFGFTEKIEDPTEIDKNFLIEYGINKMTEELIKIDKDLLKICESSLENIFNKNIFKNEENNYIINF